MGSQMSQSDFFIYFFIASLFRHLDLTGGSDLVVPGDKVLKQSILITEPRIPNIFTPGALRLVTLCDIHSLHTFFYQPN